MRANIYMAQHAVAGALRLVRGYVVTIAELGRPDIALSLFQRPAGLLIITGPTGHGKTTSQAALRQALAQRMRLHSLTIEDPVEYTLEHNNRERRHSQTRYQSSERYADEL